MHTLSLAPKARRPKFALTLLIHDLNNVPLVSGLAYVKWHIRDSPLADSRGQTPKTPIKEHKVVWNYTKATNIKMLIDRAQRLSSSFLILEIVQEYSGRERIVLGTVEINLAEYAGRGKETRRYLMQDSKINSTLQVSIELEQTSGNTGFMAPDLKPQQVFSGLAGVIMTEPTMESPEQSPTSKGPGHFSSEIASLTSHSREKSRIQDIYRRSLAASWQLQAGEMNAVDCIEDIFSGGNGWRKQPEDENSALGDLATDKKSRSARHKHHAVEKEQNWDRDSDDSRWSYPSDHNDTSNDIPEYQQNQTPWSNHSGRPSPLASFHQDSSHSVTPNASAHSLHSQNGRGLRNPPRPISSRNGTDTTIKPSRFAASRQTSTRSGLGLSIVTADHPNPNGPASEDEGSAQNLRSWKLPSDKTDK